MLGLNSGKGGIRTDRHYENFYPKRQNFNLRNTPFNNDFINRSIEISPLKQNSTGLNEVSLAEYSRHHDTTMTGNSIAEEPATAEIMKAGSTTMTDGNTWALNSAHETQHTARAYQTSRAAHNGTRDVLETNRTSVN